jgi:hypothetical protein
MCTRGRCSRISRNTGARRHIDSACTLTYNSSNATNSPVPSRSLTMKSLTLNVIANGLTEMLPIETWRCSFSDNCEISRFFATGGTTKNPMIAMAATMTVTTTSDLNNQRRFRTDVAPAALGPGSGDLMDCVVDEVIRSNRASVRLRQELESVFVSLMIFCLSSTGIAATDQLTPALRQAKV